MTCYLWRRVIANRRRFNRQHCDITKAHRRHLRQLGWFSWKSNYGFNVLAVRHEWQTILNARSLARATSDDLAELLRKTDEAMTREALGRRMGPVLSPADYEG